MSRFKAWAKAHKKELLFGIGAAVLGLIVAILYLRSSSKKKPGETVISFPAGTGGGGGGAGGGGGPTGVTPCPTGQHRDASGACVPDTFGVPGQVFAKPLLGGGSGQGQSGCGPPGVYMPCYGADRGPSTGIAAASGYAGLVRRPTSLLTGERGTELVLVAPLGSLSPEAPAQALKESALRLEAQVQATASSSPKTARQLRVDRNAALREAQRFLGSSARGMAPSGLGRLVRHRS